jgi:hypothetical protein
METRIPQITSSGTPTIKLIKNSRKWKFLNNPLLPNKAKINSRTRAAIKILRK